ncbi:hypothetical protein IscW_ISCW013237, partial [Ixodes scapularis]
NIVDICVSADTLQRKQNKYYIKKGGRRIQKMTNPPTFLGGTAFSTRVLHARDDVMQFSAP